MKNKRFQYLFAFIAILLTAMFIVVFFIQKNKSATPPPVAISPNSRQTASPVEPNASYNAVVNHTILLDDFRPQPYQGESVYFFNRLGGDRGAINDSVLDWGNGQVTTTIFSGNIWGGAWMSLNHPIREGIPIDFSAILPSQILPNYQSQITGITVAIARGTPNSTFKLELKDGSELRWKKEIDLDGGPQVVSSSLPTLGNINQFVWVLDQATAGDYVVLESISFTTTTQITDTATAAFVWSYGMLLNNWNPTTGLVRDKAKDASGEFDAIQSTGSLAAATAIAKQLGIVTHVDAVQIVDKISNTLLIDLPRYHGLWPHFVKTSSNGEITIAPDTEWSSVDTVIAAIGLLTAQNGLGLDTSGTEQMLQAIDWNDLIISGGISHGYKYTDDLLPSAWDAFGGESWLVALVYAGVTGQVVPINYPSPPTANGSGFIDELAWLFVPPPPRKDYWGTDWAAYRLEATDGQIEYYSTHHPQSCFGQLDLLFGLSAAEVPDPSLVSQSNIYQAFGVGGNFASPNDGETLLGELVVVPHYAGMIASLRPDKAVKMWDWLIEYGYFSPLTTVESLMFPTNSSCDATASVWNQLKGSWNLSLQALGWGRYLAEREGQVPILWQAATANPLLHKGYLLLSPNESSLIPISTPTPWTVSREAEYPDENTVGQLLQRSNASASNVHGQFGTVVGSSWPAKSGYVKYNDVNIPQLDDLYLKIRYSKYSTSSVPILIYIDDESTPRAAVYPTDQGDWNQFAWTEPLLLGSIKRGVHSIKFSTAGQQYGVADLDMFILANNSTLFQSRKIVTPVVPLHPAATPYIPMMRNPGP